MSLYQAAVVGGVTSLELAATGENAGTRAAYDAQYMKTAKRLNALDAKTTAERNISALTQDKIRSSNTVRINQAHAEANARVMAAASGASGTNVDDVIQQTRVSESNALSAVDRKTEHAKESQLAAIFGAQSTFLSVRDDKASVVGDLLSAFGNIDQSDFRRGAAALPTKTNKVGPTDPFTDAPSGF